MYLKSVPSYCLRQIWRIYMLLKNTHTCERGKMDIDEREISKLSSSKYIHFQWEKVKGTNRDL